MSAPRNTAPTAGEWRDAFYDVEGRLARLESRIQLAVYLAGILADEASEAVAKSAAGGFHG